MILFFRSRKPADGDILVFSRRVWILHMAFTRYVLENDRERIVQELEISQFRKKQVNFYSCVWIFFPSFWLILLQSSYTTIDNAFYGCHLWDRKMLATILFEFIWFQV